MHSHIPPENSEPASPVEPSYPLSKGEKVGLGIAGFLGFSVGLLAVVGSCLKVDSGGAAFIPQNIPLHIPGMHP